MTGPAERAGSGAGGTRVGTGTDRPARDDRRALGLVVLGLLAAAATLWASGTPTWFTVDVPTPTRGRVQVAATGAQLVPAVTAVAALLLAAVAALVALSGIARRVLGVLVGLAGLAAAGLALRLVAVPPSPAELASARAGLNTGAAPSGVGAVVATPAPWLAVAGGVVALATAVLLLVREPRMPRLGARYAAPGGQPAPPSDPDRAAWERLDAGDDPTVEPREGEN